MPQWEGGANNAGTVFEVTDSGFFVFAGTPGKPNCHGRSVWAIRTAAARREATNRHGGLNAAAAALAYSTMQVLQNAIAEYCAG